MNSILSKAEILVKVLESKAVGLLLACFVIYLLMGSLERERAINEAVTKELKELTQEVNNLSNIIKSISNE